MHKKYNGYILATVLTFIFITMFVIFGSSYIFSRFVDNMEVSDIYSDAEILLGNQYGTFKKTLFYNNANGGGYSAIPPDKHDLNNDDDDYNGTPEDIDGVLDDDGEAFKYKFGIVLPEKEENVLLMDIDYFIDREHYIKDYPNGRQRSVSFSISTLSGITVYFDKSADYRIEIFDGNMYAQDGLLKQKNKLTGIISPGNNIIPLNSLNLKEGDILALFINNYTDEAASYRIGGIDNSGNEINYFTPVTIKPKNVDFYGSIIKKDKFGYYLIFKKFFSDVLDEGKKPIAPSYLDGYGSGTNIYLTWDINDLYNTGTYYLFRGPDKNVRCTEEYFFQNIPYGSGNHFEGPYYHAGTYYYTMCSSNSTGGAGFSNVGTLSEHSNIIGISGDQFTIDWLSLVGTDSTDPSGGGTSTDPSTTLSYDGICGKSNFKRLSTIPTTGLCNKGIPTEVTGSGPWVWQCLGVGTGNDVNCTSYTDVGSYSNPGLSCQDILDRLGYDGSFFYRIKPDSDPQIQVYCDMTTDGGGWTKTSLITKGSTTRDAYNYNFNTTTAMFNSNFNIAMNKFSSDINGEDLEYMIKRDNIQVGNIYTDVNKGAWNNLLNCGVSGCYSSNPSVVFDSIIKYKIPLIDTRSNWSDTFAHNWDAWNWSIASGPNRSTQGFILHSSASGEDGTNLYTARNSSTIYNGDSTWTKIEIFVRKRNNLKIGSLASLPGLSCWDILVNSGSTGNGMYRVKPDSNPASLIYCGMDSIYTFAPEDSCDTHTSLGRTQPGYYQVDSDGAGGNPPVLEFCNLLPKTCVDHLALGPKADGVYPIDPDGAGGNPPIDAYCDMTTDGGGWTLIGYASNNSGGFPDLSQVVGTYDGTTRNNGKASIKNAVGITKLSTQFAVGFHTSVNYNGNLGGYLDVVSFSIPNPSIVTLVPGANGTCTAVTTKRIRPINSLAKCVGTTLGNGLSTTNCGDSGTTPAVFSQSLGATRGTFGYGIESLQYGCANFPNVHHKVHVNNSSTYNWSPSSTNYYSSTINGSASVWVKGPYSFDPEKSCYAHRILGRTQPGDYWIDPDGVGGTAPYTSYCDMTKIYDYPAEISCLKHKELGRTLDGYYQIDPDGVGGYTSYQMYCEISKIYESYSPELTCLKHKQLGRTLDGYYWIDIDGSGVNEKFLGYCDMTTDGGGWLRVSYSEGGTYKDVIPNIILTGVNEMFYSYVRKDNYSQKYAYKFLRMRTYQCGLSFGSTTLLSKGVQDYVGHLLQITPWGNCPRGSPSGQNNILVQKITGGIYGNDTCLDGTLNKTDARSFSRGTLDFNGRTIGINTHRISNTTVLFGTRGDASGRCANVYDTSRSADNIGLFVR